MNSGISTMTKQAKQVFTFGCGQEFAGFYAVIYAETEDDCRAEMFRRFGIRWSMQYKNEQDAGVKKWGLKRLLLL